MLGRQKRPESIQTTQPPAVDTQKVAIVFTPDPRLPLVGMRWQHACHPHVYECQQRLDGVIEVMWPNSDEVLFEVHGGYDALCSRDMGQGLTEEITEEE